MLELVLSFIIAVFALVLVKYPRSWIPPHLSNHPVFYRRHLVPESIAVDLRELMHNFSSFPSNVGTKGTGFIPQHPHIGEAVPINLDGSCNHPYLFPSVDKTMCHLPERTDIGKHYIMTGGFEGSKENFNDLLDRVSSFTRYTFVQDLKAYPPIEKLFASEEFQSAALSVCPDGKKTLDPHQFSFIVQVPGQTVAMHLDAPYFWGATRFQFPQWLLASMAASNLFSDQFIDQIQVVAYLHKWSPKAGNDGGEFIYYSNDSYIGMVAPEPLSGSIVDGSKTFHAAKVYMPHVKAPSQPKGTDCTLLYVPDEDGDMWEVRCDGNTMGRYSEDQLRMSLVYRARCFESAAARDRYHSLSSAEMMTLSGILHVFEHDLVKRGIIAPDRIDVLPKLDLAFLIMNTYINYPLPPLTNAIFPVNYCALTKYAWLKPILSPICH
jgi:hypothetical protein